MTRAPHNPPFRADHVGSFLRPPHLLNARADRETGKISAAELQAIEDDAIRDVVKFQESLGLQSITDGEYRRAVFYMGFYGGWAGSRRLTTLRARSGPSSIATATSCR